MIDHLMGRGDFWSRNSFEAAVQQFFKFGQQHGHHFHRVADIDRALVCHANELCVAGVQHHHGTKLSAAFLDRWSAFGKMGWRNMPRYHGTLEGWKNLRLARSRTAHPLVVWEAVANSLVAKG